MKRRDLLQTASALALLGARPAGATLSPRPLVFPRDHGTHNEARTEWWYLTGQAQDAGGRLFGFQITFFRSRVEATQAQHSRLAAKQLLFAHAAISDIAGGRLWHDQRIARWNGEAGDGAFASAQDSDIRLGGWRLLRRGDGAFSARAGGDQLQLDITATPTQTVLLQGEQGWSRKGPQAAQASFYLSQPQLRVSGRLGFRGQTFDISSGTAWLDHEWSDALLHPDAVGWDWIGMNLLDGSSLTAFQLRRKDGSKLWAGGSFRSQAQGRAGEAAYRFAPGEVDFVPQRHWVSSLTGARYPVEWRVRTPADFYTIKALIDPQELDSRQSTGTVYWEGLSDLFDSNGQRVGRGYLEMTGYAQRLIL
jgi:predicted secreted hydrolase